MELNVEKLSTTNHIKAIILKLRLGKNKLKEMFKEWRDLIKQFPSKTKEFLATMVADLHGLDRKLTAEILFELESNPKLVESLDVLEITTTSSMQIKPGSGLGFGTDELDREKDTLLIKRKKQLSKTTIKQLTGEQTMKTVVTFTSKDRDSIGLQYTIIDNHNHTSLDTWELTPIKSEGDSHSFMVISYQPDQFLTMDNLERNMVAGVEASIKEVDPISVSERVAESMINAVANGMSPDRITESYLNAKHAKFQEQDDEDDGESKAVDDIQSSVLAMMRMTDNLELSDENAKEVKALLDKAMAMMKGETQEKKKQD